MGVFGAGWHAFSRGRCGTEKLRKRKAVLFGGGFHGRTMMGMALTGKVAPYKTGFGPFPGEVFHALFPNPLHGVTVADSLRSLEHLFKYDVEPDRVAAIILEPVQGEGGFYVAPQAFAEALRALCDQHGILLIADEVQTGAGRTGTWLACEQWDGVAPDIITMAKSMAGGMPLSAIIGRAEVMDAPAPGGLGGTYAGNPLACASALAVLDVFEQDKLLERSRAVGQVRVAAPMALAATLLPGAVDAFAALHPGVAVQVCDVPVDRLVDAVAQSRQLKDGKINVADVRYCQLRLTPP
mgnify:CR=1 FL=1